MLFLKKCIFFFTWILTSIFKRDKKIILCAGWFGHRFADNSRYIFLYLNEHKKYLGLKKIIWITNNPQIGNALKKQGYSVCKRDSLLGIYYHLRAFYFFCWQSFTGFVGTRRCTVWCYASGGWLFSPKKSHQKLT